MMKVNLTDKIIEIQKEKSSSWYSKAAVIVTMAIQGLFPLYGLNQVKAEEYREPNAQVYSMSQSEINKLHETDSLETLAEEQDLFAAPAAPVLYGCAGDGFVNLWWDPVTGAAKYRLYVNDTDEFSTADYDDCLGIFCPNPGGTEYQNTTSNGGFFQPENGEPLHYWVTAVNSYGEESSPSNSVELTPQLDLDGILLNVNWQGGELPILLQWMPSTSPNGYEVWSGTDPQNLGYDSTTSNNASAQPDNADTLFFRIEYAP
ncbi:hypothetical protein JW968_06400 [Candidatus Woesearchaeota archaeon]|nr:hypothetical protein [Candidatus Woesearchaeota archaeon]